MPYTVTQFESTPNPTAVKCLLDRPVCERPRSFLDASAAAGDPIASALFALPGVRNILIGGDWITVNTTPGSDWRKLKPAIRRILSEAP